MNIGSFYISKPRKSLPVLEKIVKPHNNTLNLSHSKNSSMVHSKKVNLKKSNLSEYYANINGIEYPIQIKSKDFTDSRFQENQDPKQNLFRIETTNSVQTNQCENQLDDKFRFEGGFKNLSEYVSNRYFKAENPDFQAIFTSTYQKAQKMETKMGNMIAEIKRLDKLNKYLLITQKYKEDLLCKVLEENRRLREQQSQVELQLANKACKLDDLTNIDKAPISLDNSMPKSLANTLKSSNMKKSCQELQNFMISNTEINKKRNLKNTSDMIPGKNNKVFCANCLKTIILENKQFHGDNKENPKQRFTLLDSILESSTISSLLFNRDMHKLLKKNTDNPEITNNIQDTNENFAQQKSLSSSVNTLKNYVINMTHENLSTLYDSLENITQDLSCVFKAGLRIKEMFDILPSMMNSSSMSISEQMEKIAELVTSVLECDKAIVYQIDFTNGELCSQAGTGLIDSQRFKIGEGVCGWVALNNKEVNIREAQSDLKFKQMIDASQTACTQTIQAIPIYNKMNEVDGVIQAINKKPLLNGMLRYFSPDDEGLLKMIAKIASLTFKNSDVPSEQALQSSNLQSIIKTSIFLNTFHSAKDLIIGTENKLKSLFNCEKSAVYFLCEKKQKFYTYNKDDEKVHFEKNCGLIGDAIKKKSIIIITNPLKEKNFNSLVDIETTMPVLVVPIICSFTKKILGAFQVINGKGIEGLSVTGKAKITSRDYDIVDYLSMLLAQYVINQKTIKKMKMGYDGQEQSDLSDGNKSERNVDKAGSSDCDEKCHRSIDGDEKSHKSLSNQSLKLETNNDENSHLAVIKASERDIEDKKRNIEDYTPKNRTNDYGRKTTKLLRNTLEIK